MTFATIRVPPTPIACQRSQQNIGPQLLTRSHRSRPVCGCQIARAVVARRGRFHRGGAPWRRCWCSSKGEVGVSRNRAGTRPARAVPRAGKQARRCAARAGSMLDQLALAANHRLRATRARSPTPEPGKPGPLRAGRTHCLVDGRPKQTEHSSQPKKPPAEPDRGPRKSMCLRRTRWPMRRSPLRGLGSPVGTVACERAASCRRRSSGWRGG